MAIWVVVLEAIRGPDDGPDEIGPDDLDAFADELGDYYPVVAGSPTSYEAELWVEESSDGLLLDVQGHQLVVGAGETAEDVERIRAFAARTSASA